LLLLGLLVPVLLVLGLLVPVLLVLGLLVPRARVAPVYLVVPVHLVALEEM
jgi:hypothetical protein